MQPTLRPGRATWPAILPTAAGSRYMAKAPGLPSAVRGDVITLGGVPCVVTSLLVRLDTATELA
jgi:hypothetical protein